MNGAVGAIAIKVVAQEKGRVQEIVITDLLEIKVVRETNEKLKIVTLKIVHQVIVIMH